MPVPIHLLYIDDDEDDARLFVDFITSVFRDVDVQWIREPYPSGNRKLYSAFDAFIIDYHLSGGVVGTDVAREIHDVDWRKPKMLLSGHENLAKPGIYFTVDHIGSKNDPNDVHGKVLSLLRAVAARRKNSEA